MLGTRRRRAPAHARTTRGDDPGGHSPAGAVHPGSDARVESENASRAADPPATTGRREVPAEAVPSDAPSHAARSARSGRAILRAVPHRDRALMTGGAELRLLVLACTPEDTTAVDLASGSMLRLRIPWPSGHEPDLSPFDVVEATLADDPECDDLAKPEAATVVGPPRHVGSLKGRRVRGMLARIAATHDGPLLGFPGPSAPYWDFHGLRPSVALIHPTRGPQLMHRHADGSTWVRFGWERDDVWLPVEDGRAVRALAASRRDRLTAKPLATALGFSPHYLLVALTNPRGGHCYKICQAVLPKG